MIKTIIFDADGMVLKRDILPSKKISEDFKIPLEKINVFFNNEFQLCKIGKLDTKKVLKNYLKNWGWKKSTDEFLEYWFKFDSKLNNEMIDSIKELRKKGIKCYLATNNEKNRVKYFKNILGFKNIFNGIFSSDKIGYQKSQQEFWKKVYKKLGNPNKETVLCWDNDSHKIEAAKNFGFLTELYTNIEEYKNKINKYLNKN